MAERVEKTIYIKWVRSGIGFPRRQKAVVRSLGLRRLHQVVERPDTAQVRGLVASVPHLVMIVEKPQEVAWRALPAARIIAKTAATAAEVPGNRAEDRAAEPSGETSVSN